MISALKERCWKRKQETPSFQLGKGSMYADAWGERRTQPHKENGEGYCRQKEQYLQRLGGDNRAWCISGTERRAVRMDQSEKGERSTRRRWRRRQGPGHRDLWWLWEALDFILNTHKEALVDFSKTEWQEPIYLLKKYLLNTYNSSDPETQCHRVWHTVRAQ